MTALRNLIFFSLLLFCCSTCKEDIPAVSFQTKHVVIIIIDGPRWTETWGEPTRQFIPGRVSLMQQGVLLTNFRNEGYTYTNAGHTAITTGYHMPINNSGQELPLEPGIFQYFRKAKSKPADKVWLVASKDKLHILTDCQNTNWQGQYRPNFDVGIGGPATGYRTDSVTHAHALNVLNMHHPDLMMISYREPDVTGHMNDWPGYLQQIRNTDQYVTQIWNALQNDPYYAGTTTLFVTNDHGRHLDNVSGGFGSHGDACEGCRKIELLAVGPDFKRNAVSDIYADQRDIARTTAYLLGFPMETGQGHVLEMLFR
jgi:Type I phosphodiesterase / nucleotide pyrophosphatase